MEEFIAGLVGGTAGLIVGHPFDTIKALMQTKSSKNSLNTSQQLFNESHVFGFFRGLSMPLLSFGVLNSFLFGIYSHTLNYMREDSRNPRLSNVAVAGMVTGFISSIPTNPVELVKLRMQTHSSSEIQGVFDCTRQIYKRDGFKGFFKGFSILVMRDTPSYALYFVIFEAFRQNTKKLNIFSDLLIDFIGGGFAGAISWFSIMPFDTVKSRIQADISNKPMSFIDVSKSLNNEYGFKGYFRGVNVVLVRGFVVNAVTLCVWSRCLNYLEDRRNALNTSNSV